MVHDPIRAADTRAWLARAEGDLKVAAHELTAAPPFTADAVFHAQQSAEKAMKGFLAYPGEPEEPSLEEAEAAIALAREAFDAIVSVLPREPGLT